MHSLAMKLGQNALVLKEFAINNSGPEYVHIVARRAGLIAWVMTQLGIDTTTTFQVFADKIVLEEGSLSGNLCTTMPLSSTSIAVCGYTKPFSYLVAAIIMVIISPFTFLFFILPLLLAGFFIFSYFLNKTLVVSAISHSGLATTICFKKSVIEGVSIEYAQAQEVINIINQLIIAQTTK